MAEKNGEIRRPKTAASLARDNEPEELARALAEGLSACERGPDGLCPMEIAIRLGREECVKALMSAPHGLSTSPLNPLMLAASAGQAGCARLLLEAIDPKEGGEDGMTPLHFAAKEGKLEVAKELLALSNPLALTRKGNSPLMLAINFGHKELVELLGPVSDWSVSGPNGSSLLMMAARAGEPAVAALLMPASDPLLKNDHGRTALMQAVLGGSLECVELLAPVSDLSAQDNEGRRAADYAADGVRALLNGFERAMMERQALSGAARPGASSRSAGPRI